MQKINLYILEKLKLTKNKRIYTFKPIETDIKPFWGYNWILNNEYLDICYSLLKYALDNFTLTENEENFINDFIEDIEKYYSKKDIYYNKRTEIINGKINNGYYQRPKCIYDIAKYLYDNNINIIGLKDRFGDNIDDEETVEELKNIIIDIENITNDHIKKLDWPH